MTENVLRPNVTLGLENYKARILTDYEWAVVIDRLGLNGGGEKQWAVMGREWQVYPSALSQKFLSASWKLRKFLEATETEGEDEEQIELLYSLMPKDRVQIIEQQQQLCRARRVKRDQEKEQAEKRQRQRDELQRQEEMERKATEEKFQNDHIRYFGRYFKKTLFEMIKVEALEPGNFVYYRNKTDWRGKLITVTNIVPCEHGRVAIKADGDSWRDASPKQNVMRLKPKAEGIMELDPPSLWWERI